MDGCVRKREREREEEIEIETETERERETETERERETETDRERERDRQRERERERDITCLTTRVHQRTSIRTCELNFIFIRNGINSLFSPLNILKLHSWTRGRWPRTRGGSAGLISS